MLNVNSKRPGFWRKTKHREWLHYAPKWQKVRHALAGELVSYLRNVGLNEPDKAYGEARQAEYEAGGIVYNFTRRTLSGMVGSVMRKEPEINIQGAGILAKTQMGLV